jgi:hypothetical protein
MPRKVPSEGKLVELEPKYIVAATSRTQEWLLQEHDSFGDNYTKDLSPHDLHNLLTRIPTTTIPNHQRQLQQKKQPSLTTFTCPTFFPFFVKYFDPKG